MEKPSSDYIQMRFKFPYPSSMNHLGYRGLLPFLEFLEASSFPKPFQVEFTGKSRSRMRKKKIDSFLDPELLKIIEPIGSTGTMIRLHTQASLFFSVYICQSHPMEEIVMDIDSILVDQLGTEGIQKVFVALVQLYSGIFFASCCFVAYYADFNRKYRYADLRLLNRPNYFPFLVWLQYVSAEALAFNGTFADFEFNPLLQTQHLGEGLLVQVGDSPFDIYTDAGEALLAQATFSLPPFRIPDKVL